jgi:hypothetical protein
MTDPVERIKRVVFHNKPEDFTKIMWRMTKGNKEATFKLIREITERYGFNPSDFDIDNALAELTGGCEVEWVS